MSIPTSEATSSRQRTKIAIASVALAVVGVTSVIALTSSAQAGSEVRPAGTFGTIFAPNPNITIGTLVQPTFGPPQPTFSLPPFTFLTIPIPSFGTVVATAPDTTTTNAPTTTAGGSTTTTTDAPGNNNSSLPQTPPPGGDTPSTDGYTLDITAAQVNCDGTIHVEYATTATPEPPTAADHLVVFNATSNPADFRVVETVGNAPNGAFVFEQLGSNTDTYRVFVIALFEPTNLEGPKLVDQTDVLLAPNCA